jgi:hypothetical protein
MVGKNLAVPLVALSLSLLATASAAFGQTCPAPPATMFPPAPAAFTQTAVADGNWNAAATWSGSTVPGNNAIVCIPAGRTVTVTSQETSRLRFIQVNGTMKMWIQSSTRLYLDTLFVASGGAFTIGDPVHTVKTGNVAELVFISWDGNPIDRTWDPTELSRGFISMGTVDMYGEAKTHMVPVTADVLKTASTLTADSAPTNWHTGDSLVLTGSYFRRVSGVEPITSSQDERVTMSAGSSGTAIVFSPALVNDHVRPRSDLRLHLANLTRNVVFSSESTSIPLRGHVMLMTGTDDIRDVAFINMGRTDKTRPLDDFVVTQVNNSLGQPDYNIVARSAATVTNRRGRYALHFHLNGTVPGSPPPSKVYNSVVDGTVGWGFVSHSSHVDFQNNVAYNFAGAGFVTEFGDELGNFTNNVAIRGTGDGEYRTNRLVFANAARPQPLTDFAFTGDGFWFQGPAVTAVNNVASGCDGTGMIWFTTGAADTAHLFTDVGGLSHDYYTSFQRSAVPLVYASFPDLSSFLPRYWDNSTTNEKLIISDLPILQCDGLESYGNLVGFRLRFNNYSNTDFYTEDPYNYDNHIVPVIGSDKTAATRMRQNVKNLTLWNNELGLHPNYTMRTDWSNVLDMNRLDYDSQSPYDGAEINFQIQQSTFTNLTIDGYEVAGWIENADPSVRAQITFTGQSYLNYANFDTWNTSLSCPMPSGVTVTTVSSTSRKISWTFTAGQKRYLVRYRANGDQQWKLVDTSTVVSPSVTLTGLATGKTYTYQVIAGCKDVTTGKETAPSTYTVAATFNT